MTRKAMLFLPWRLLRTLDAIHTAACDLSQDFPLCTTDRRMRDAAKALHIPIFPEGENA